jgi:hypothetical protein
MMKLFMMVAVTVLAVSVMADSQTGALMLKGMSRGTINMASAFAEPPVGIFKDCQTYSVVGVFTGMAKGSVVGVGRFLAGFADFVTLGLLPDSSNPYDAFCLVPTRLERPAL